MSQQHTVFTVSRMCRLLEVSRSGYYEWLRRSPRDQAEPEQHLQHKVVHCLAQGRGTYGTRRIKYLLAQEGLVVSRRVSGACWPRQVCAVKHAAGSKRRP
jgi:hypothetical protein